jgi:hypothetical protein
MHLYGTGESGEHRQAKYQIAEALRQHPDVTKLAVERPLGEVRPDVSFCWQEREYVAIELQISETSPDEIARRTHFYTHKKMAVLWTRPYRRENMSCLIPYRAPLLERYLHALYFGNVYYWLGGERLLPVHFERYPSSTELRVVASEDEGKPSLQLIHHCSPVFRNLNPGEIVQITDLKEIWRLAQQTGHFVLPTARLWMLPRTQKNE